MRRPQSKWDGVTLIVGPVENGGDSWQLTVEWTAQWETMFVE